MNGQGAYCPRENCDRNRNGLCMGGLPVFGAYATNATNMASASGFLAPFTPAAVPLGLAVLSGRDPDLADEGERWENCAYWREHDLRR